MSRGVSRSLAIAVLLAACLSAVQSLIPGCVGQTCPKPPARCPRTWSYDNQDRWGSLCNGWATCSAGAKQSPINIFPPVNPPPCTVDTMSVRSIFPRPLANTYLFNTGNLFAGAAAEPHQYPIFWNGLRYHFDKFAFHSPSEHVVNGKRYDLELQLSFKGNSISPHTDLPLLPTIPVADQKSVLNFAVFFQRSAGAPVTNQFLEQFVFDLPQFSDCSCGNNRWENHLPHEAQTPTIGVTEECDNGALNSNASRPAGSPNCCRNNCRKPICGDGVLDWGEQCDNGALNRNVSNLCRTTCCLPTCGDGILDSGEECDDGNRHNLDGCSSICKNECGDGELNLRTEQCDDGVNNSDTVPNSCRKNCRVFTCGDFTTDTATNETCDGALVYGIQWGNGIAPSQCRSGCVASSCGDGLTDNNEQCDDGASNGVAPARCSATCALNCGNGVTDAGEQCDDGAANSLVADARCRPTCVFAHCGDGIIDLNAGEQCDSVYTLPGTNTIIGNLWCTPDCKQRCGSGICPTEDNITIQCDHGCYNLDAPNRCRQNCQHPRCGDGIVDSGELCDNGDGLNNNNRKDACRTNCRLPYCGDGVIDSGEQCDDQNNVAGDGCDPLCRNECGNGNLEANAGEECDLGLNNSNTADNCRTNCKLPCCGDGIVDSLEECDKGVNNSDTTGNACRKNCRLPYCGDGIIDTTNGEKCDNGAANSDTVPFGCSTFCIPNYCRQRKLRNALSFESLVGSLPFYEYSGSQTTPPCTENVRWVVMDQALDMSDFQFSEFNHPKYGLGGRGRALNCQTAGRSTIRPCRPAPAVCGNGVLDAGEACDLGWGNSNWEANRCRLDCRAPSCGDGVTDRSEECDDGAAGSSRCTGGCALVVRKVNPFASASWSCAATCKWAFLSSANSLCAGDRAGAQQSPINLDTKVISGLNPTAGGLPARVYTTDDIHIVNSGRQLTFVPSHVQTLDGAQLERVEFHSPSEHTINGAHADLEAQFIHKKADGSFVGLALLYKVGAAPSPFLSTFEFYVPKSSDCQANNGIIDAGEQCDDGILNSDVRPGACRRNGRLPSCGDGIVDRGEQCDPGRHPSTGIRNQPTCQADCTYGYCGDASVGAGEQCDNGVNNGHPEITSALPVKIPGCTKGCERYCGNGLLDDGYEQCDNGAANANLPNVCRTNCQNPRCGDGIRDDGEVCDEGLTIAFPNSCRPACVFPTCGDGVIDNLYGEQCDNGINNGVALSNCDANCKLICGNGVVDAGEDCDLGLNANTGADSVCRANCRAPSCGDGILDTLNGEECENPGTLGCSPLCKLLCGNGVLDLGEQCDAGTNNDDTVAGCCRTNCRNPSCGDGVQDAGEQCDFGTDTKNCRGCLLPRCGDGTVDAEEECDDGNANNGDGCSNTCLKECGNGRRDGTEFCDNGALNARAADQCRPDCTLPRCGDGVVDSGEQCDDGPGRMGNGDSQCRSDCTLPYCGDGHVDTAYGERCDDGAANTDSSVTGCSTSCTPNSCRSCSAGAGRSTDFNLAVSAFSNSPFVRYSGSLTTPPCSESVTWYVSAQPATITARQAGIFAAGGCPRGVQPLNGRVPAYTASAGAVCGNCVVEAGEQCDTGDNRADAPNKCKLNCRKPACGDGYVDDGEECDAGAANAAGGPCNLFCKWVRTCAAVCTAPPPAAATCTANSSGAAQCSSTINNQGTIIHVNFARLLQGAGCTGPNCANN